MDVVEVVLVERDHAQAWADRLTSDLAGSRVVVGRHCPTCGSTDHGRPLAAGHPGLHVSLARAGSQAVVAAASVAVGVDVEVAGSVCADVLEAADLGTADDPTLAWVTAEARGKLAGSGLLRPVTEGVVQQLEVGHGLVVVLASWADVRVTVRKASGAPDDGATAPGTPRRRRR